MNLRNSSHEWDVYLVRSLFNDPRDVDDVHEKYIPRVIGSDKRVPPFLLRMENLTTKSAFKILSKTYNFSNISSLIK